MTRLEELTLQLTDEALTDGEACELESLLLAEPPAIAGHTQLLDLEGALRGQRETLDLAGPTLARLHSDLAMSVARGVMQRLEAEPPPAWATPRRRRREPVADDSLVRRTSVSFLRQLSRTWNRPAVLAFAASVMLFVGLSLWLFGATMGHPTLAGVKGAEVFVERGTESIRAMTGMPLQAADEVRVGPNASGRITFGAERTQLELTAGTQLKLVAFAQGKRFVLTSGEITASVARQRPFHPMNITTTHAEVRVLGTEFSLRTTTNATRLDVTKGKVRFTRASDGAAVRVAAGHYAVAASNYELAALPLTGGLFREYWTNVPGDNWTYLITHPNYPDRPDGSGYLTNLIVFEMPPNRSTNFGERLRGYVHPPATGAYTFWIAAAEGHASVWLSPDENPKNRVQMAGSYNSPPGDWQADGAQRSAAVDLTAGKRYWIEVLHKVGGGEGQLAVAWQGPGREREIIPLQFLSPLKTKGGEKKQ